MSDYRRWFVEGGTFFFTVVTHRRRPFLTTDSGRSNLREAIKTVRQSFPFEIIATCLLPDHWHLVMQLPAGDSDYSIRMKRIKSEFTLNWTGENSRIQFRQLVLKRVKKGMWQPRFWEHTVQDADDLGRCCDYIHWNPVKHGLTQPVRDWPWSSFHRFVEQGQYEASWGKNDPEDRRGPRDWGE